MYGGGLLLQDDAGGGSGTVLDLHLQHGKRRAKAKTGVRFEDPHWSTHLPALKPIGLSCLLSEVQKSEVILDCTLSDTLTKYCTHCYNHTPRPSFPFSFVFVSGSSRGESSRTAAPSPATTLQHSNPSHKRKCSTVHYSKPDVNDSFDHGTSLSAPSQRHYFIILPSRLVRTLLHHVRDTQPMEHLTGLWKAIGFCSADRCALSKP